MTFAIDGRELLLEYTIVRESLVPRRCFRKPYGALDFTMEPRARHVSVRDDSAHSHTKRWRTRLDGEENTLAKTRSIRIRSVPHRICIHPSKSLPDVIIKMIEQ